MTDPFKRKNNVGVTMNGPCFKMSIRKQRQRVDVCIFKGWTDLCRVSGRAIPSECPV